MNHEKVSMKLLDSLFHRAMYKTDKISGKTFYIRNVTEYFIEFRIEKTKSGRTIKCTIVLRYEGKGIDFHPTEIENIQDYLKKIVNMISLTVIDVENKESLSGEIRDLQNICHRLLNPYPERKKDEDEIQEYA